MPQVVLTSTATISFDFSVAGRVSANVVGLPTRITTLETSFAAHVAAGTDHGDLHGLTDDDHLQYARLDGLRKFESVLATLVHPVFNIGETAHKSSNYIHYSDPGSHSGGIRGALGIVAEPVGSGLVGPASLDTALILSVFKQGYGTPGAPTTVAGEVTGLYINTRQGTTGDNTGFLASVASFDNIGFQAIFETHSIQYDADGVQLRLINNQAGTIDVGNSNYMGFHTSILTAAGSSGLNIQSESSGSWDVGINLRSAILNTAAMALPAGAKLSWVDSGGTLRGVLRSNANAVVIGYDALPPTNGHLIFSIANEVGRFSPTASLTSGGTALSIAYHNGVTVVVDQISLAAAAGGFRALQVPE